MINANGLIVPDSYGSPQQVMLGDLRMFYLSLTAMGEGYVWLIQPGNQGDNVWLFTCEHNGMQTTHTISDDMLNPQNASIVRDATFKAFNKGKQPEKKFKTHA